MPTWDADGRISAKKAERTGRVAGRKGTRNPTQRGADTGFDGRKSVRLHLLGREARCEFRDVWLYDLGERPGP